MGREAPSSARRANWMAEMRKHAARRCEIVAEILDIRTRNLFAETQCCDYVLSNELMSKTLAMVSEDRLVNLVLKELFSANGNAIFVRKSADYVFTGEELSFFEMQTRCRHRGEVRSAALVNQGPLQARPLRCVRGIRRLSAAGRHPLADSVWGAKRGRLEAAAESSGQVRAEALGARRFNRRPGSSGRRRRCRGMNAEEARRPASFWVLLLRQNCCCWRATRRKKDVLGLLFLFRYHRGRVCQRQGRVR